MKLEPRRDGGGPTPATPAPAEPTGQDAGRPAVPPRPPAETHSDLCRAMVSRAPVAMAVLDLQGAVIHSNPALDRLLGHAGEPPASLLPGELAAPEEDAAALPSLPEIAASPGTEHVVELRVRLAAGGGLRARMTLSALETGDGPHVLAVIEDVSRRRPDEDAREHERVYFTQLFESLPVGIAIVDADDRILRINPEFTRLFGYTDDDAVGRLLPELILLPGTEEESLDITGRVSRGERIRVDTVRRHRDGSPIDVSVVGSAVRLPDGTLAVCGIYQDIRERKSMERALRRLSRTDALTGLLNRRGFFALGQREWELARRREEDILLLFLDLDDFKVVNDRLGHATGDRILKDLAGLIKRCFRSTDVLARIGGDEFVILGVSAGEAAPLIDRLQGAVERYNEESGHGYPISLSIGCVATPALEATSLEALLEEADARMYTGKRQRGSAA